MYKYTTYHTQDIKIILFLYKVVIVSQSNYNYLQLLEQKITGQEEKQTFFSHLTLCLLVHFPHLCLFECKGSRGLIPVNVFVLKIIF